MNSNGAEQILAEHGYGCFYFVPDYWQWKDGGRYTVDVMWNADGTIDTFTIQSSRRN